MEHIEIERDGAVGWVWLSRPEKLNAMSPDMWEDLPAAVADLDDDQSVRVVIVAGRGNAFTVGIDVEMLASVRGEGSSHADRAAKVYREVVRLQRTMTAFARCSKPVIAAIHGYCLGAGVDLITACDIRLSTPDATFGVRETRMGLVADVGTTQRLPKLLAPGHVAELLYTGKDIDGTEAARIGLVNRTHPDRDSLFASVSALGGEIASNSPLVVQGIKKVLQSEETMSTEVALHHMALWNAAFLESNDLLEAMSAFMEKRPPRYTGT